ncbi:MAG: flavin reductase family protein [Deltaproteobacteria bacterium]|jgi:flavin reductase (DIM6/NTAB) family NADH-FMN oxidoreductase RutF|nr:flavin reductase family protein [Deltaproteobacteria bacterium]
MKIDPANLNRQDAHALLVGAILPRPIAFVSTVGKDGIHNIAPFSFFTGMSTKPAVVGFAVGCRRDGTKKDTLVNIEYTKDYVINLVNEELAEAMNQAAGEYPSHVDEFKVAGLTPVKSDLVKSPRVAESPVNLECRLMQILEFGQSPNVNSFIIGEVIGVHVQEETWIDGVIKASKVQAIGRLGEDLYCRTKDIFEMKRPRV